MIDKFDRTTCRKVGDRAEEVLTEVAESLGLTLTRETGRFTESTFTFKATFKTTTEAGRPIADTKNAILLGLPANVVGRQFTSNGKTFTVTGINMRRRKYPVSGEGVQGGRYKFTVDSVLRGLA